MTQLSFSLNPQTNNINIHIVTPTPGLPVRLKNIPNGKTCSDGFEVEPTIHSVPELRALNNEYDVEISEDALHRLKTFQNNEDVPFVELKHVPVNDLPSVNEKTATSLEKVGIESVWDLLHNFPLRYIDRSDPKLFNELTIGDTAAVTGVVVKTQKLPRNMCAITIVDANNHKLRCVFFNAIWQLKRFKIGDEIVAFGKVEFYEKTQSINFVNPIIDKIETADNPIIPIYPQSGKHGITTWMLHKATLEALRYTEHLSDPIPPNIIDKYSLMAVRQAIRNMHVPSTLDAQKAARRRLAYEELLTTQYGLAIHKQHQTEKEAVQIPNNRTLTQQYIQSLPFPLTHGQNEVINEILTDMESPHPMNRLLQGDVGAGKTIVAITAILHAVDHGYQATLMAPTGILGEQLYTEIEETCKQHFPHIKTTYLSNKLKGKKRDTILQNIADGTISIVVGTHAIIADDVTFHNLGIIIVDEQHRFGVEQRATLKNKRTDTLTPNMLIMTATPIPRTSALTVFGDLTVSTLKELPPGRTPIKTTWIPENVKTTEPHQMWNQIQTHVNKGNQVFIVCPLVDESLKLQVASVTQTADELKQRVLQHSRIEVVHGQMKAEERTAVMERFKAQEFDVLVATTVIEVGVNIPNATMIVILDAPRFGIAQLHQLRGRVGRGRKAGECVVTGFATTDEGRERLQAFVDTTNGFELAEQDFRIRGSGALAGVSQSGASDLLVADLQTDTVMLECARDDAATLIALDDVEGVELLRNQAMYAVTDEVRDSLNAG